MKIALSFPGCHRRGGVERVMLECANFLADRGHEMHAFSAEWDMDSLSPKVVRHQVACHSLMRAYETPAFVRASRRELTSLQPRADVVAGFGAASMPGSIVWMQSVHAAWIEISRRTRNFFGRLKQRLNPFHRIILDLERELIGRRRYRKIVALTPQVRDDVMRLYGVPGDDVVVIPNGYCPREFSLEKARHSREPMRQRLGFTADDKVVIFVANEVERKGFHPLLEAMAQLDDSTVQLLAVGRLDAKACARRIARLGLTERVRFTGPTSEVADYFAAADVFALPTQYEAWGLVIVEAMACGLPVLTSRLAGASVAVCEGETGSLLDDPKNPAEIAQKLRPLLAGPHVSVANIARSVERYRWSHVLLDYEATLVACAH
jgi:UDP-glucose:(heptosyl)LPS alpha-1,3-glucosyltransferase